jgi:cellulose synthase operon protein YhjQ
MSPKGGVGKTTFAANLAASLTERAGKTLAVDLDPQNALRLHFGIEPRDDTGLGRNALHGAPWQEAIVKNKYGVDLLPFGELGVIDQADAWHATGGLEGIDAIINDPLFNGYSFAIVDTPPGPAPIVRKMIEVSDLVFVVLTPDAASFACIPHMKRLLQARDGQPIKACHLYYILNQMDARRRLHRDVRTLMSQLFADSLLDFYIHSDASVSEALAQQQPVLKYAPQAQSARDFKRLAQWLGEQVMIERAVS